MKEQQEEYLFPIAIATIQVLLFWSNKFLNRSPLSKCGRRKKQLIKSSEHSVIRSIYQEKRRERRRAYARAKEKNEAITDSIKQSKVQSHMFVRPSSMAKGTQAYSHYRPSLRHVQKRKHILFRVTYPRRGEKRKA